MNSSDVLASNDTSVELSMPLPDVEPSTREIGTDPMEQGNVPVRLPTIQTTKILSSMPTQSLNQLLNTPIIIIQSSKPSNMHTTFSLTGLTSDGSLPVDQHDSTVHFDSSTTVDQSLGNCELMTPSPSNDSLDDGISSSPDMSHDLHSTTMITNLTVRTIQREERG
jgi:hypothetical protein